MTSTKRGKVTKIWAIFQMVADKFRGGGIFFFRSYVKFSNIF